MVKRRTDYRKENKRHPRAKLLSLLAVVLVGGIGVGGYYAYQHVNNTHHEPTTSVTSQAKPKMAAANTTTKLQDPAKDTPAQKKLRAILLKQNLSGVVISTTVKSNEPFLVTNGMSNILTKTAFTSHTLFPISSFEKMYTGIIIDKLIAEKKLTLNTRLDKFFPDIRFADRISIQNLLSHTSGIQSSNIRPSHILPDEASQLDFNLHAMRSTGIFKWSYSSANYALLASIITKITGKSYQTNVENVIVKPLGLKETFFYNRLPENPDLAYPEKLTTPLAQQLYLADTQRIISGDYGSGDLFQSVGDFYKVLVATETGALVPKNRLANFFPGGSRAYTNGMYIQYGLIHAAAANLSYYGSYYGDAKTFKNTVLLTTNGTLQTIRVASVDLYHVINH